jgi:hypothetical protein
MNWTFTRTAVSISADRRTAPILPAVRISNGAEEQLYVYTRDSPFTWPELQLPEDRIPGENSYYILSLTGSILPNGLEWSGKYGFDQYPTPGDLFYQESSGVYRFTGSIELTLQSNGKYTKSVNKDEEGEVRFSNNKDDQVAIFAAKLSETPTYNGKYTQTDVSLDLSFERPDSFMEILRELWSASQIGENYITRTFNPSNDPSGAGFLLNNDTPYLDPTAFRVMSDESSFSLVGSKEQIGIGDDQQLTLNIKADIQNSPTKQIDVLEVRIPKGFTIKESSGLGSLRSTVVDTSRNGDTILTFGVTNASSSTPIDGKLIVEATGLSQPSDKLLDHQWTSNFAATLRAPDGSNALSNSASLDVLVDSSKGIAQRLAANYLDSIRARIDQVQSSALEQLRQVPKISLYPNVFKAVSYVKDARSRGARIRDVIASAESNLQQQINDDISQPVIALGKTIKQSLRSYVAEQTEILAKASAKNIIPGFYEAIEQAVQASFSFGLSFNEGLIGFRRKADTSQFNLNVSIGNPARIPLAALEALRTGNTALFESWATKTAEKMSVKASFTKELQRGSIDVRANYDFAQNTGSVRITPSMSFLKDRLMVDGRLGVEFSGKKANPTYGLGLEWKLSGNDPSPQMLSPLRLMEDSFSSFSILDRSSKDSDTLVNDETEAIIPAAEQDDEILLTPSSPTSGDQTIDIDVDKIVDPITGIESSNSDGPVDVGSLDGTSIPQVISSISFGDQTELFLAVSEASLDPDFTATLNDMTDPIGSVGSLAVV